MTAYAGIRNPRALGKYGVEQNSRALRRYRYLHEGLMRCAAAQLPAREHWDLKAALGKHLYEDAEAAHTLRERVAELRTSPLALHKSPNVTLTLLFEELIHAASDMELLVGIYRVIKPAMLQAYERHMQETQQLVDQPTVRALRTICLDMRDQLDWAESMIRRLSEEGDSPAAAQEFADRLALYLNAAGGADGEAGIAAEVPDRWRSGTAYEMPRRAVRDPRRMGPAALGRTPIPGIPDDPTIKRLCDMMKGRQEEMSAVENLASVIYDQKEMPWEFYRDAARHLWDEVRHALFGQAALEAEGIDWAGLRQYVGGYDPIIGRLPALRYTLLTIGFEERAMKRPGKVAEYEFCRDEAKHPLMTRFQDYDWADEVTHAAFGRKWAPELFGEDLDYVREVADREVEIRERLFAIWAEEEKKAAAEAYSGGNRA